MNNKVKFILTVAVSLLLLTTFVMGNSLVAHDYLHGRGDAAKSGKQQNSKQNRNKFLHDFFLSIFCLCAQYSTCVVTQLSHNAHSQSAAVLYLRTMVTSPGLAGAEYSVSSGA